MDYKAAWEDLQRELAATIATHEGLAQRHTFTEAGDASNEAYKTVAAWMKHAEERAAKPDDAAVLRALADVRASAAEGRAAWEAAQAAKSDADAGGEGGGG